MGELMQEFERFEAGGATNPSHEDKLSQFLRELDAKRELKPYTEEEWRELARREGLNDEEAQELIEQAAGWVSEERVDITDQEPSDWPSTRPSDAAAALGLVGAAKVNSPKSNSQICSQCATTHHPSQPCPDDGAGDDEEDENPEEEDCEACGCDNQDCELCDDCEGCDCCCNCDEKPEGEGEAD